MACTGAYADANDYVQFWCLDIDLTDVDNMAQIGRMLALAAADLHGPLSAAGACDCLTAWALELLKKWNVIEVAVFYKCACGPGLDADERRLYLEWLDRQMELVRTGKMDLCGKTGAEWPAFGVVELNHTAWSGAEIIANRIARTGV